MPEVGVKGYFELAHGLLHHPEGVEKRLEKEPLMIQKQ